MAKVPKHLNTLKHMNNFIALTEHCSQAYATDIDGTLHQHMGTLGNPLSEKGSTYKLSRGGPKVNPYQLPGERYGTLKGALLVQRVRPTHLH